MVDRGLTRHDAANNRSQTDAIKLRMEITESISRMIREDPSIYQCIDRDRMSLVMGGNGTLEDVLYVFRMCKLRFMVEPVDISSAMGEWY